MPGDPASNLVPAPVGNGYAIKHGAYAVLRLRGRAEQIRAEIEPLLPLRSTAYGPMLDLLSMSLAQAERASMILGAAQLEEGQAVADGRPVPKELRADLARLAQDLRGWISRAERLLGELGLSPRAAVGLGFQVAQTENALQALDEHLRRKREAANG